MINKKYTFLIGETMDNKKVIFCASVFVLISAISLTGQAADQQGDKSTDKTKTESKVVANVPIVVDADHLTYSDATGDLVANGNVSVVQNDNKITTDSMRGNSKQTEFWIDNIADFYQKDTKLTGTGTHYNYTKHVGSMQDAKGIVGRQHVAGTDIDMLPGEAIIHNGMETKCPAKVPDYHISAEKIEIWPGEKMIAYNAKFWIGKIVLFTLPKYQTSLRADAGEQDAFPRVGYHNDDGFYIMQHIEHPISDKIAAFVDVNYYSKAGFKPQYGLTDKERNYSLSVMRGDDRDGDGNWIKKEPEFNFNLNRQRLGDLPVSYTFSAIYGKWADGTKTSWHQDYNLYFSHDTIALSKSLSLGLGTGFERVHESFDGSTRDIIKFDTSLTKQWTPRFTTTGEYHYTQNNNSLFNYNVPDLAREADIGFTYKIDKKNTIGFRQSYDLNTSRIYDQDYTWYRDLHCWQATITYRAKRNSFNWALSTTRW